MSLHLLWNHFRTLFTLNSKISLFIRSCHRPAHSKSHHLFHIEAPRHTFTEDTDRSEGGFRCRRGKTGLSASYTLEASILLPLFIAAMAMAICLIQIFTLQFQIQTSLRQATRQMALLPGKGENALEIGALTEADLLKKGVNPGLIRGKWLGISYAKSRIDEREICAVAEYQIALPIPLLGQRKARMTATASQRRWTGWDPMEKKETGEMVYVTASGVAYHRDPACVYLNPRIHSILGKDLSKARNDAGAKYKPGPSCPKHIGKEEENRIFYITEDGLVYHDRLDSPALRRHVSHISLSEALARGYHACPRCAGQSGTEAETAGAVR